MPPRLAAALAAWGCQPQQAVPLGGGANSRVFLLTDEGGRLIVAKLHHVETGGDSPRYHREKSFYAAARGAADGFLPEELHWDDAQSVAFLQFIEGESVADIDERDVRQAGTFVRLLQQADRSGLEAASEAALQPGQHVQMVERRLVLLQTIANAEAAAFVAGELRPRWESVRARLRATEGAAIVSPSDFGFHNALRRDEDFLCFFDFEHAGLDDPAKLVCDFFVRPEAGVPVDWLPAFCEAAGFKHNVKERAERLMNLYRVKWACIALNEFTAEGAQRRGFAGVDEPERQAHQLAKARALLREVTI
jgi:hypothetical protein